MWSLCTFNKYGEFIISHHETKEFALDSMSVTCFSPVSYPDRIQTFEEFCLELKNETNPGRDCFHWRPNENEFINLEFHNDIQKKVV